MRRSVCRAALAVLVVAAGLRSTGAARASSATPIQHVIIIIQENRSFDTYFGTYPGANGITPGTCLPLDLQDRNKGCVTLFHNPRDYQLGGNHDAQGAQLDLDDGITRAAMDGFVAVQAIGQRVQCAKSPKSKNCSGSANGFTWHDVAGYQTADDIPNYWSYAQHFVLQDAMFPGIRSWSTPAHVDLTSEWMAECVHPGDAASCRTISSVPSPKLRDGGTSWPWVSMFELLDKHSVSWKYYRTDGSDPDCDDAQLNCEPTDLTTKTSQIWNPPPFFKYVQDNGPDYLAFHNPTTDQFLVDLKNGTLPQVSWIIPNGDVSEHPHGGGITLGMEYVTSLVNAVMQSDYWQSSVVYIVWDDWGGFYDHVVPPTIEFSDPLVNTVPNYGFIQGLGLRVPGIAISPWIKAGSIDHQILSFASYNRLIEDLFMNGARLDPAAMGRPDARPTVRDAMTTVTYPDGSSAPVGDMMKEFDFNQAPLPKLVLSTHIPGMISIYCRNSDTDQTATCLSSTVKITWYPVTNAQVPGPFTYHVVRDGVELAQCVGTANVCTDVPGSGAHLYRVYSVDRNNVASPLSAAAEADEP